LGPLGADLKATLRELDLEGPALEGIAVALWPELVGPHFSAATRCAGIRGGVLEIVARDSSWLQELTFHKADIIARLNRRLGKQVVISVRARVGRVTPATGPAPAPDVPAPELETIEVPESRRMAIEAQARHPDPEVAALIRRALTRQWQLNEWRRRQGYRPCAKCGALCEPPLATCPACGRS
jgi:predicted nucleic acid-binding Zn ribbon protein